MKSLYRQPWNAHPSEALNAQWVGICWVSIPVLRIPVDAHFGRFPSSFRFWERGWKKWKVLLPSFLSTLDQGFLTGLKRLFASRPWESDPAPLTRHLCQSFEFFCYCFCKGKLLGYRDPRSTHRSASWLRLLRMTSSGSCTARQNLPAQLLIAVCSSSALPPLYGIDFFHQCIAVILASQHGSDSVFHVRRLKSPVFLSGRISVFHTGRGVEIETLCEKWKAFFLHQIVKFYLKKKLTKLSVRISKNAWRDLNY